MEEEEVEEEEEEEEEVEVDDEEVDMTPSIGCRDGSSIKGVTLGTQTPSIEDNERQQACINSVIPCSE